MSKYRILGTMFNRLFRNDLNANFDDIDTDIKTQKLRVDNLINETSQPSEVVDARGTFQVLRDRLDDVDMKLDDKTKEHWIDVRDFGVKGDGVSDDGTLIQNAINLANGLKPVYIPNMVFGTNVTITLPTGTIIFAEKGATIKALNTFTGTAKTFTFDGNTYTNTPVLYAKAASNIQIEGLQVDGNKANNPQLNVSCIMFENCTDLIFERVKTIDNKTTTSASLSGGAFFLSGGSDMLFKDCEVDNVSIEGLHLRNVTHVLVRGGEYQNSTSSVIGTQYGGYITIDGVKAHDTDNSVISLNSPDSKVVNSQIYNSRTYGGLILGHRTTYETRKAADRSIIANNHIFGCYAGGIIIQYGKNLLINGNQIYNCNGAFTANDSNNYMGGIDGTIWADSITVTDNIVSNCNRGIYLKAGKADTTNSEFTHGKFIVANNKVYLNKLSGIQIGDCRFGASIQDNIVQDNNVQLSSGRAEILINFDFTLGLSSLGGVQLKNNIIGNLTSNSGYQGILISVVGTPSTLTYPVIIEDNQLFNMSTMYINNLLDYSSVDIKNNYINGNLEQFPRVDIATTTTTLNIGYAKYVRLTGSGSFNIDTITHKHATGTEILLQAVNTPTLLDASNLFLNGNFVMNSNDIIVLKWTGGAWLEVCRSSN